MNDISAAEVLLRVAKSSASKTGRPSRECTECSTPMLEGYIVNGGEEYYCSDECLQRRYDSDEWQELYANGEGDSYWTEWED